MSDPLSGAFGRPFAEQVAAFRLRLGNLVPTATWRDLERAAHDRAFMVAGAMKADLLADLGMAVDRAIAEGASLEEFRRDFRGIVEKHGWHGWTGEGSRKGEAWRTRVIYRTNIATTYAAGRMAQLRAAGFPLWIYSHGGSVEPRLQHLGWDGLVLPADHEFWATHAPPNGWGCSCRVFGARDMAHARRKGGDPGKKLPEGWKQLDPRTGTPRGIGKGWDYAPGASVSDAVLSLRGKLDQLPDQLSVDLIQSWLIDGGFMDWLSKPVGAWPLIRLTADDAASIGANTRIADLSAETALKQARRHPELSARDYAMAQRTVEEATHRIKDGPRSLIFLREAEDGHVMVVKATRSGEGMFVTSFRRLSRREAVRDQELRRLLRKGK